MAKHVVFVSIGSNIERDKHIREAVISLRETFCEGRQIAVSPVYETRAVGFEGDNFYNLVARFNTNLSPIEVSRHLKLIEDNYGRDRKQAKFSARTLDIDLLLYDALILDQDGLKVPRDEIKKYAFVLAPLADLAPQSVHPQTGQKYESMWLQMKNVQTDISQSLIKIDFNWSKPG